jgi:long-chain fatty acid transport protein
MKALRHFLAALSFVVLGSTVQAAGFNTPQSGASYTAQGQGGITFFDNAGLVVQNPSAMVKLETGTHVYGGFARYETHYNYKDLNGGSSADTQHGPAVVPHLYALYNDGDMAFGTGANLPFNSGVEWPKEWAGRDVLTRIKVATLNQPLVVAGRFGDFSIGGGLNFYAAHIELEREVNYDGNVFSVTLGGKGTANGYNASVLYDGGTIAAAANYTSRFTVEGEGDAQFDTGNAPPALTYLFPDGGISVDLNYPDLLEMAVAWKSFSSGDGYVSGAYAIELGMLRSGWSAYEEVSIKYDKGRPGTGVTVIEQNWEDVVDYKIGGFYTFTDYLKIRGGYYKTASPIPEETLGPTTPDGAGRNSFYLGAGYKRRAFLMDLAYVMSDFLPSETRTNPDLTGKYKGNANVLQLSAGYSF